MVLLCHDLNNIDFKNYLKTESNTIYDYNSDYVKLFKKALKKNDKNILKQMLHLC